MSKWEIVNNNMLVNGDFKNDAALLLSGDWNSEGEMQNFLTDVCNKLNHYAELEAERLELVKACAKNVAELAYRHQDEVDTLKAENAKLREKLEYFSGKNTEYLNEIWDLQKENVLLKRPITSEMVKEAEIYAVSQGREYIGVEFYELKVQYMTFKLNELRKEVNGD